MTAADTPARATPVRAMPAARPGTAADRLQRLLTLVPYVISRNAVSLADTAAAFGVTERQLVDDLNMLWCVELRSPDPYCPIDLSYEGGEIVVSQAESIGRPLRLGPDEASALLVALRMMAEMPGLGDRSALSRTIAKLEVAAGAAAAASAQVAVQLDDVAARDVLAVVTGALAAGRRLHLSYYVPGRDEATERDVDPMRLLVVDGRTYLEGWCRRAEAVRLFRLDRVLAVSMLDIAASVPGEAQPVVGGRPLGRRVLPLRAGRGPGRGQAEGQPADAGHPVGAAAGAAPGRGRPGDLAGRARRPGQGRCERRAGTVRIGWAYQSGQPIRRLCLVRRLKCRLSVSVA